SCEGISERNYGQFLRLVAEKHGLPIFLDCKNVIDGGDPLKIVEESIKQMERSIRNHGNYAVKAIMLDSDKLGETKSRDDKIPALVRKYNVKLIYSRPNIEALLLRHFNGCEHLNPPANRCLAELQKVWPEYYKGVDSKTLYQKLGIEGLRRACQAEADLNEFLVSIGFNFNQL